MDYKANFDFHKLIFQIYVPPWIQERYFKIIWETDYDAALTKAAQTNKIVFTLFRGSDWCGHCISLDREVLNSVLFRVWAILKVVLLDIDFPHNTDLPPDLVQQNITLYAKYNVQGVPTAIGLNHDGSERGRLVGYSKGTGPQSWLIQFETNAKMNQLPLHLSE